MTDMLQAALDYARDGVHVFPVYEPMGDVCACKAGADCESPAKHPRTANGFHDATTDESRIRKWWARWPYANIAIATEPSSLLVIDIDPRHGGSDSLHKLERAHGELKTRTVLTGGGGSHLWFRAPRNIQTRSRSLALGNAYPGIDSRASGGYIVAPPSGHISGSRYEYEVSASREIVDAPPWLLALLAQCERTPVVGVDDGTEERIREGERHTALASLAGRLRRNGMRGSEILDALRSINQRRCAPPLADKDVRSIAKSSDGWPIVAPIEPREQEARPIGDQHRPSFIRAGELLAESDEDDLRFALDGLLLLGGTAILVGRPKGGKSTWAVNLALRVARGEPFMGRETRKGPVLYLALEGAKRGWKATLRKRGVTQDDDLYFCIERAPEKAIAWLHDEIEKHRPVLVIVDTVQRLLRVRESNEYAGTSNAFDAIIELARRNDVALLLLHHSGKTKHQEIVDEVMGSTAWAASPDTVLVLRRSERYRTIAGEQRFGDTIPETVLTFDQETLAVDASDETKADVDRAAALGAIVQYLREQATITPDDSWRDESTIHRYVEGRRTQKIGALRDAVTTGQVLRIGEGKKGSPYRYSVSGILVPEVGREQENENRERLEKPHNHGHIPGSHDSMLCTEGTEPEKDDIEAAILGALALEELSRGTDDADRDRRIAEIGAELHAATSDLFDDEAPPTLFIE